jgi:hypothetical protein
LPEELRWQLKQREGWEIEGNRRGGVKERGKRKECEMGCVSTWGVF